MRRILKTVTGDAGGPAAPRKGQTCILRLAMLGTAMLIASTLFSQSEVPGDDVSQEAVRFTQTYSLLEQNYMNEIDPDQAVLEGSVRGMLSALDPYSSFFNRDQFEMLKEQTRGQSMGFGSILYVTTGKVVILQTAERSP